jgi:soluble lytic murein transglycosylase-like protein
VSVQALLGTGAEASPQGVLAAGERVQRLQALISEVEQGSAGFAAALDAAKSGGGGSTAGTTSGYPAAAGSTDASAATAASTSAAAYPAAAYAAYQSAYPAAGADDGVAAAGTTGVTAPSTTDSASAGTGTGSAYTPTIEAAAARNGIDPAVLYGLIQQESNFDPTATSGAGALGLTQLMPGTAASLGVTEPLNPAQSIEGGARYLGQLMHQFGGNVSDALAAYNAGPGAVQQYGGIPPYAETQQYVTKVLDNAAAYSQSQGTSADADVTAAPADDAVAAPVTTVPADGTLPAPVTVGGAEAAA